MEGSPVLHRRQSRRQNLITQSPAVLSPGSESSAIIFLPWPLRQKMPGRGLELLTGRVTDTRGFLSSRRRAASGKAEGGSPGQLWPEYSFQGPQCPAASVFTTATHPGSDLLRLKPHCGLLSSSSTQNQHQTCAQVRCPRFNTHTYSHHHPASGSTRRKPKHTVFWPHRLLLTSPPPSLRGGQWAWFGPVGLQRWALERVLLHEKQTCHQLVREGVTLRREVASHQSRGIGGRKHTSHGTW